MPYAFTENGIAMLSGVLRSSIAIEINIRIMRAFVAMRRVLANVEPLLSRIESVERRQITDQSKNEARFDEIFAKMGAEIIPGLLESIRKATSERREYGNGKRSVFATGVKVGKSIKPRKEMRHD